MFLEHLGVQIDHVGRLLFQCDDVDSARQSLQADIRPNSLAEGVHHVEGGFSAVQKWRLEPGAATCLEMRDARRNARFNCRDEVLGKCAGTKDGLESVTETGVLKQDFLGHDIPTLLVKWFDSKLARHASKQFDFSRSAHYIIDHSVPVNAILSYYILKETTRQNT